MAPNETLTGLEIVKLAPDAIANFVSLLSVFAEAFEWEKSGLPKEAHLQKVLQSHNFLVFVAKNNQKVVGGLTAYVLEKYEVEKPSAYIYDIAVSESFQRKGIGKQLIASFMAYCQANGFDEAFVQAVSDDAAALRFYRSSPISSQLEATHFTYSFGENSKANG